MPSAPRALKILAALLALGGATAELAAGITSTRGASGADGWGPPVAAARGPAQPTPPPRQMEYLGRGVVALNMGGGKNWVSWRLVGTDPDETAFNVYRVTDGGRPLKLNFSPIRDVTFYVDDEAPRDRPVAYYVRPVLNNQEGTPSKDFLNKLPANAPVRPYIRIPLDTPTGYSPGDASVGDLDGDGEYEIVLHQNAPNGQDNSKPGTTGEPILQAYKMDGTKLWEINLGKNIREGAHYTQFMVYDLDGDGQAEVVCKTADGTKDGQGKVIGNAARDYRNKDGYVLDGPEFLTVFNGATGAALDTVDYIPERGRVNDWGDGYGNRVDRFLACVAYLDGVHPSVVLCRGYYTRTNLVAWDFKNGQLVKRWHFDSRTNNDRDSGQGNHNLSVADVDGDGKDEIIYGSLCINDDGKRLWNTGNGHGDALHVSDLDPARPGLEIFQIQEEVGDAGAQFIDAKTGNEIWKKPSARGSDEGPGRAVGADIDAGKPGAEFWVAGGGIGGLFDVKGARISNTAPNSCNFIVLWDGDTTYELLDKNRVDKWSVSNNSAKNLLAAEGATSNNGTKSTPVLSGDILGDWREEILWRDTNDRELRLYTTTIPTDRRMYTLAHDPQYRLSLAWQNVAYNQPPHTGFFMGANMPKPPKPNITLVNPPAPR